MVNAKELKMNRSVCGGGRLSLSFKYALFLIFYTIVYYYFYESASRIISYGLTFLGFAVSAIFVLFRGVKINSMNSVVILLLMMFSMIITNIINTAAWGSTVTCITMLSGLCIFANNPLKKAEVKYLTVLFSIFVIIILLNCNIGNEFIEGKFNPNSGGFVLSLLFCVFFTRFLKNKRFLYLAVSFICIALQIVYISRTALLCCILFAIVNIIFYRKGKTLKSCTVRRIVFLLGVLGLFIAFFYSHFLFDLIGYNNLQIFGKDLFTGREVIWRGAFKDILSHPVFGVGNDLNAELVNQIGNHLLGNAHNQSVGIIATFGIPVFIAYYWLLSKSVVVKNEKVPFIAAVFIFTFIIMSYFDVYFFAIVNVGPILIAYCLIRNCCKSEVKNDNGLHACV